jgi:hypothetical protein
LTRLRLLRNLKILLRVPRPQKVSLRPWSDLGFTVVSGHDLGRFGPLQHTSYHVPFSVYHVLSMQNTRERTYWGAGGWA